MIYLILDNRAVLKVLKMFTSFHFKSRKRNFVINFFDNILPYSCKIHFFNIMLFVVIASHCNDLKT